MIQASKIYFGNNEITAAYLNNVKVWPKATPPTPRPEYWYRYSEPNVDDDTIQYNTTDGNKLNWDTTYLDWYREKEYYSNDKFGDWYFDTHTGSIHSILKPLDDYFNTPRLTKLILPAFIEELGMAVYGASELTHLELPYYLYRIEGESGARKAFSYCEKLETITLPPYLKYVENATFWRCTSLKEIKSFNTTAPELGGANLGYMLPETGELHYPKGSDYSTWIAALPEGWTAYDDLHPYIPSDDD